MLFTRKQKNLSKKHLLAEQCAMEVRSRPSSSCYLVWRWQASGDAEAWAGGAREGRRLPGPQQLLPRGSTALCPRSQPPAPARPLGLQGAATPSAALGASPHATPPSPFINMQRDGGGAPSFEGKLTSMTNLVIHAHHQPATPDYSGRKLCLSA